MNVGNYKLPVNHRFENVALSDHLRPHTSFGYERHSTYKQNNRNNNTNTCGWTDTYDYNNPYPSYPRHHQIWPVRASSEQSRYRPDLNSNYSYIPSFSHCIPPPPPPPPPPPLFPRSLVMPDLKRAPAPEKDSKHIKPIPMKHTNVKKNPELKSCLWNAQKSEITTSKIAEKPYSPPVLPIPTFYDAFEIIEKGWEVYNKSIWRVKRRDERAVVSDDCIPKKISLVDYLSKKKLKKEFHEGE
ncbi:unnamed protein product [Pieris macdunnoughi]|uniref:Uncharacterized protein n=1 Tax=Pieris macdunnoughi TaxID=345717 RepID=A0A821YCR1_9NEOP|nr:unnamed protein product [Pieris macdunnoughi]